VCLGDVVVQLLIPLNDTTDDEEVPSSNPARENLREKDTKFRKNRDTFR
jgi:hypothetical protein